MGEIAVLFCPAEQRELELASRKHSRELSLRL